MPLYDFICEDCGEAVEKVQAFDKEAPVCCGKPMKRGFGNLTMWFWKSTPQSKFPSHNSKAMAQAATNGYKMVHGET